MKVKEKVTIFIATGGYVGKIPAAPGTFGSMVGLIPCILLKDAGIFIATTVISGFILFSIWVSHECEKLLNQKDPGCIVIDEIAGMMVTLFGLPVTHLSVLSGFLVFRIFDILKPFPIRFFEKKTSGGFGIVFDDIIAGAFGNIVLRLGFHLMSTT